MRKKKLRFIGSLIQQIINIAKQTLYVPGSLVWLWVLIEIEGTFE